MDDKISIDIFIAFDGDNVGSQIELYLLQNKLSLLQEYSIKFNNSMDWIVNELIVSFRAIVYLRGGDSLLIGMRNHGKINIVNEIENLRHLFAQMSGSTLSVGLGSTPLQAHLALKLAKSSGKNCFKNFSEIQGGNIY